MTFTPISHRYLGDGRFHLESIMIANPDVPAFRYVFYIDFSGDKSDKSACYGNYVGMTRTQRSLPVNIMIMLICIPYVSMLLKFQKKPKSLA